MIKLVLTFWALSTCVSAFGQEAQPQFTDSVLINDVNPFHKDYLTLEFARNYPMSFSQNRFKPGKLHPSIGYWHNVDEKWIMGVAGQFRIFGNKAASENIAAPEPEAGNGTHELAIWSLHHVTYYVVRLDHPTYLLAGPKVTYMVPAKAATLPFQRDPGYETEIGGGLSVGITRIVSDRWLAVLRFERWRGTRTMRFHGLEVSFGFAQPI